MTTEKRLIDANEVWHKIHKRREAAYRELDHPRCNAYLNAEFDVMDAPTVDAVEVVRCKDCKYWMNSWVDPDGKREHGYCNVEDVDDVIVGRWGGDFCSYGERKTDV